MKKLTRRAAAPIVALVIVGVLATVASARVNRPSSSKASLQVCALLPDTKSSVRYTLFDAPYLSKAFKAAHVKYRVVNAHGSTSTQKSQGDQCLSSGAKVLLVDGLNSGVAASIENAAAKKHAKTIDYDRLTLHGKSSYYVSFNNVNVGKLQGKGVAGGLKAQHT